MTYCYNCIGNPFPLYEPPLEPYDEEPVGHADCGCELYKRERTFEWEGRMLCINCWREEVKRLLEKAPEQLAFEMGLEVEFHL